MRRLCALMVCLLAANAVAGVAQAYRIAEHSQLRGLGLLDAVICHGDPASTTPGKSGAPERQTSHHQCDCCLTGCGAAGPVALPDDHGAILRALLAANDATDVALDADRLRSYLTERTRSPRSPPDLA